MTGAEPTVGQPETQTHGNSIFTPELGAEICALLAQGLSLNSVCKRDGMPDKATVFRWLAPSNEAPGMSDFRDNYTRAKEEAADALAEEILDIADNTESDFIEDGEKRRPDNVQVQRDRLRVDTRKFLMAKMKPKKYGDKIDVTSGGERIEKGASIEEIEAVLARAEAEKATSNAT